MSKSVLIIDTPESCMDCGLSYDCCCCSITNTGFYDYEDNFDPNKNILDNCPLSPLPSRKVPYVQRGDTKSMTHLIENIIGAGYNQCLDDLQKGVENER